MQNSILSIKRTFPKYAATSATSFLSLRWGANKVFWDRIDT